MYVYVCVCVCMRGRYVSFVLGSFVFRVVVEFGGIIAFLISNQSDRKCGGFGF